MTLMALREGLASNMLYANGASTMRNFIIVVAWHGGFPKVSTSCIDPRGSTFSPENPLGGHLPVPASPFQFPFCQMPM